MGEQPGSCQQDHACRIESNETLSSGKKSAMPRRQGKRHPGFCCQSNELLDEDDRQAYAIALWVAQNRKIGYDPHHEEDPHAAGKHCANGPGKLKGASIGFGNQNKGQRCREIPEQYGKHGAASAPSRDG